MAKRTDHRAIFTPLKAKKETFMAVYSGSDLNASASLGDVTTDPVNVRAETRTFTLLASRYMSVENGESRCCYRQKAETTASHMQFPNFKGTGPSLATRSSA